MTRAEIVSLIVERLGDLDAVAQSPSPKDASEETALFGPEGTLDSLGLVALIVDVEEAIAERSGVAITLGDDRAVSQHSSPFRTVGSLADYITTLAGSARS
jgi:D-alanine--poly(phosphoribitol) ligase subunit 2